MIFYLAKVFVDSCMLIAWGSIIGCRQVCLMRRYQTVVRRVGEAQYCDGLGKLICSLGLVGAGVHVLMSLRLVGLVDWLLLILCWVLCRADLLWCRFWLGLVDLLSSSISEVVVNSPFMKCMLHDRRSRALLINQDPSGRWVWLSWNCIVVLSRIVHGSE